MTENWRFLGYFTYSIPLGGRRGHDPALQRQRCKHQFAGLLRKIDKHIFWPGPMFCLHYTVCIRIRKGKTPEKGPIRPIRPLGTGKFYPVLNSTAGRIPFFRPWRKENPPKFPRIAAALLQNRPRRNIIDAVKQKREEDKLLFTEPLL